MRRLLLAFAALLLLSPAFAQTEAQPAKRGFFWEAHKGAHRVYLLGTIHVGRAEFYPPHPDYLRWFDEAAVIVVEANVFDAKRVAEAIQKTALYPDGDPGLGKRLNERQKERVTALVNRFGLDPVRIWRMKPWMAANTFIILQAASLGFNPAYATEAFLFQYASAHGKPLAEIESIDAQLAIFERVDTATQVAYLEQALTGIETGDAEREVRRIVTAWEKRDAAEAERLIGEIRKADTPGERFVAERLFDARHAQMVDAIDRYAASGKLHLVAVGALHYFGPNGLLQLLRARGYAVTAVP
ncbi:MAG TPA: TraB/GumN family protein [Burkholderiaceae bacterium]|jgi:uncharacterized protein YbaP (TraB family)|nr:TraB/GumN family protein [Burkholderiaceae bacterium]